MKILMAIVALVAACSAPPAAASRPPVTPSPSPAPTLAPTAQPTPETHLITGHLEVGGAQNLDRGTCDPSSGYDDVNDGENIVIKDGSGTTIGTATLALNVAATPSDFALFEDDLGGGYPCLFTWSATVPKADFYHVMIGRRDGPTVSYKDLAAAGWKSELEIGVTK